LVKDLFRKSVVVFYWVALPLVLLACTGGLISGVLAPDGVRSWAPVGGAAVLAVLIGWRLWLNSRSVGWGGPMPPPRRLLLVFAPLAVLAAAGLGMAALGFAWLALGVWLMMGPDSATSGFRDLVTGAALPIGGGIVLVMAGAALTLPLFRSLRRRRAAADVPGSPSPRRFSGP
jgi:hypothetical protein